MRLRRLLCVLVCLFSSLLIVFSGVSIKASAATITLPSGGRFLTGQETRDFIGSVDVEYYNGSDYVSTTASYYDTDTFNFTEYSDDPVGFVAGSHVWVRYSIYAPANLSPDYITVKVHPHYSIFDTNFLYTAFAMTSQSLISKSTYQSPSSSWYIGGTVHNFENNNGNGYNSGYRANLDGGFVAAAYMSYIPIVHSQNNRFSAYSIETNFSGNTATSGYLYYFYVMCPYISDSASGGSGTFTTDSSSGGSGDINVDVDLTETNGLLGSIVSGISGIGDSIKGLFVPDEEDLVDFKEDVADILTDSFSGYSETQDMLDDVRDVLISSNPSAVLEFPALNIPGTHFATPAKSINLNFDNTTIEWVKWIIDIMATIAVVNMIQNKIKAVLVGESVVEVEEIDG